MQPGKAARQKIVLLTLTSILTTFMSRSQSWTNLCQLSTQGNSTAIAMVVDTSGHIYETGYSQGTNAVGSSGFDYATMAYTSGGVPLWTNFYNGPGNGFDEATAIAVSSNGNVYVTGFSTGNGTGYDYATIAYSSSGVPLWTNRYTSPGNNLDQAKAIAVASDGNVYVTGEASVGYGSYATIAYSSTGTPLWTNFLTSSLAGSFATAITVDGSGNVYVTGCSPGPINYSYGTIKYSGAGTSLWTNLYIGPNNDASAASAIAVDVSGNVYVTGGYSGGNGETNYATLKYSSAGTPLWTNLYPGSGLSGPALALASNGNVYITGNSSGTHGYVAIAYSSTGTPLWTNFL